MPQQFPSVRMVWPVIVGVRRRLPFYFAPLYGPVSGSGFALLHYLVSRARFEPAFFE